MFMKWLGANPTRLGIVAKLYDQYTATHLTEALMNTYTKGEKKGSGFQSVNNFVIEWNIEVHKIHKVQILDVTGDGKNASEVKFYFPENYYQKYDTFIEERSRQQFIVVNQPQRLSDKCYLVIAQINDNDWDSVRDDSLVVKGAWTRFITNAVPELHEQGYTKYTSNTESFRSYMSTHRCDTDASAMYKPMEDVFIQVGKGEQGGTDPVFHLNKAEKVCLDNFMEVRNNKLLWGKCNINADGKVKNYDDLGRPVITTDGVIPQVEQFATKFVFNKLNVGFFEKALQAMVSKSEKPQGNQYVILCNTAFYNEFQRVMNAWIIAHKTDGAFLWSKGANGYVDLGATYQSYEFAGNKLIFKVDRCFDIEYPTRKFGVMLDLTPDGQSGRSALAFYTFKGGELIHNFIAGVKITTCAA